MQPLQMHSLFVVQAGSLSAILSANLNKENAMKRSVLCLIITLGVSGILHAEDSNNDAWKKQMENKIDVLTQELENAKFAPPEGTPAGGTVTLAPLPISPYSFGPAAGKVYGVDKGLSIGGYGEMIYEN